MKLIRSTMLAKHVVCKKLHLLKSVYYASSQALDFKIKEKQNNQALSSPYPSFLSSLDTKSSLIQQRRYILDTIQNCNHSTNIISIIRKTYQDDYSLLNAAIFSCAVQRCNELNQHLQCMLLMDLMYEYDIKRDLIQYNIVLLSLSKVSGYIEKSLKYFKNMIKKDKLIPDIYTLTHLMQIYKQNSNDFTINDLDNQHAISEMNKNILKVEKLWKLLVYKYGIQPDRLALSNKSIFYANYNKSSEAIAIWDKMTNEYDINPRITTCGLLIKAFSKYGNYKSCDYILAFMKRNNMRMNQIILCSLMNCYINADKPEIAIKYFDKYVIENKQKKKYNDIDDMIVEANDILFGLKAICFGKLFSKTINDLDSNSNNMNNELINYYIQQMNDTIPYQRIESGLSVNDFTLSELQLKMKIILNVDYNELVSFFLKKLKDKSLWFIRKNHQKNEKLMEISGQKEEDDLLVGLHLYSNETAKFVLKYFFENKLNDGTFKTATVIPIIIGKNLTLKDVQEVLLNCNITFSDINLDPHNSGKVLFDP